jgi:hypothetical protein
MHANARAGKAHHGATANSGRVYPSNAFVDGRFVLRACIVNFRSEADHIEALIDLAVTIGDGLAAGSVRQRVLSDADIGAWLMWLPLPVRTAAWFALTTDAGTVCYPNR